MDQLALNVILIPIFAKEGETNMNQSDEQIRRAFGLRRDDFRRARIARMQQESGGDAATCEQQLETIVGDLSAALRDLRRDHDLNELAGSLEQASDNLDRLLAQASADNGSEDHEATMVARHMRMPR